MVRKSRKNLACVGILVRAPAAQNLYEMSVIEQMEPYRSDSRFWPVDLCCAVVRPKSASLRLVSMPE
jgi:hypothetical protein